jgi:hypothetical protein
MAGSTGDPDWEEDKHWGCGTMLRASRRWVAASATDASCWPLGAPATAEGMGVVMVVEAPS